MNAELRIGDTEREAAIVALGEHFAAGRIDKDEYDERAAAAWSARTSGALAPLFADLPKPHATPSNSTSDVSADDRDTDTSAGRSRPGRPRWAPLAGVLLIALLVTLAVTDEMPWFVAAIAAWIVWIKSNRAAWYHSRRNWHHHPGWGRPARW